MRARPNASAYPEMIHDRVASEALRLVRIVGRATLTIVASSSTQCVQHWTSRADVGSGERVSTMTDTRTRVLVAARLSRVVKGRDQVSIERQDTQAERYAAEHDCV